MSYVAPPLHHPYLPQIQHAFPIQFHAEHEREVIGRQGEGEGWGTVVGVVGRGSTMWEDKSEIKDVIPVGVFDM